MHISDNAEKDRFWYKNAVIYEVHVRAFADSNADGIGDFRGLTQKLDYLRDLGITAIWLLPFYPSPLKDDGYDIADYYSINPIYGTLNDFKTLLKEAHQRGLRVITELVVNHTSDQHPWFQRSRRGKAGSPWRDYYVWSDTPDRYKEARIIFKDFEASNWTLDSVAQRYYWHRFYSHQPELNFDNPQVHKEVQDVLDFWLDLGVDGVRLDAIPYLYEREGTSCENLPETHAYLKTLRQHVDKKYGDRMLLAEANQWPEDAVSYFGGGAGDECHMAFHFPLMPRLFMAVRMEDRIPIVDIIEQTPSIPETSQWALFLRNHDELTLEMVTDEERDYMYRVYANDAKARINLGIRRRLAPLLGNDRKKIELLNLLLVSLPGTPVLYNGDEIGMGENIFLSDRSGVRTPIQWSSDKNAGFSRATPQAVYLPVIVDPEYHYETVNVEAQQRNPHSLLWWMKRAIHLRKRWHAFGQGAIEFLHPDNRKILAFTRHYQEEQLLVVANLSRFPQPIQLNLARFKDCIPVELFGRTEFPAITEKPYFLTASPHSIFWFSLEPSFARRYELTSGSSQSTISLTGGWEQILEETQRQQLESLLPGYLRERRWFAAKGRQIKTVRLRETIRVRFRSETAFVTILSVDYVEGEPEEYLLPIAFEHGTRAEKIRSRSPHAVIATVKFQDEQPGGVLYDAAVDREFASGLLQAIGQKQTFKGVEGELAASSFEPAAPAELDASMKPRLSKAEQSNTSIVYDDQLFLKLFRRLDIGINPDLEISRFLSEKGFRHTPALAGALEYVRQNGEQITIGLLSSFVPNSKDAWVYTLESLNRFFERVQSLGEGSGRLFATAPVSLIAVHKVPSSVAGILGAYLESARLLARRTAEMHLALASDLENKDFAPEPFTPFYQRSLYQSMRNLVIRNLELLRKHLGDLSEPERAHAERLCAAQSEILKRLRDVYETRLHAVRIRCHGDYHLGQVLYTGKDFVIIDFEGEPARSIGARRIKRSPIRDVAGMIRSFHYASYAAVLQQLELGILNPDNVPKLQSWGRFWYHWISAEFFSAYQEVTSGAGILPETKHELAVLLYAHLLEKSVYELGYELNNRPEWVKIPLEGVLQLMDAQKM